MLIQSCIIYNTTKGKANICLLHKVKMKKTIVRTSYGYPPLYYDARFPNSKNKRDKGCVKPLWPKHRLALIYNCMKCDSLKKTVQTK